MKTDERTKICLRELVAQHGATVYADAQRCEAFLRDLCPDSRREVSVLAGAVREKVPEDLLSSSRGEPIGILVGRLTQRLHDSLGLDQKIARWGVETWAHALGVVVTPAPSDGTRRAASLQPESGGAKGPSRPAGRKLFNVYANEVGRCEAVKVGWSWPAFGFGAFWALCKRMWAIGFGVLLTWLVLSLASMAGLLNGAVNALVVVSSIAGWFVFGGYGNRWRERHLQARGFTLKDTVAASSARQAATLHLNRALTDPAASSQRTDAEGKTA